MRADVPRALADLTRAFASLRVRWYVFGAQAVIAAGVPRLTADIDVTVELPRGGVDALLDALGRRGVVLRAMDDPRAFIAETRVIPALHRASGLPVDVVIAGPGLEEEMLARAHARIVGGAKVPFVDTADLVALKMLAGRAKDLEDVRALVRAAPPDLSLAVARARVVQLGSLLDDASIARAFDDLVAAKPRRRPRAKTSKRNARARSVHKRPR